MRKINMKLSNSNYDILIENGLLDASGAYIADVYKEKRIFIITDDVVAPLYLSRLYRALDKYELHTTIIKHGEANKSINTYLEICEDLISSEIRRGDLLIALGGGVVGDICGFAAATIYRGIDYVNIPTTLLSQMDSSIGGKTGIDFYNRKNILGAFKQPRLVLIDPMLLKTLDKREFNNGMGELIKHGAIGNKPLLEALLKKPEIDENIIYESLMVKAKIVMIDEFDKGERMKLNFGHTFGHQLEMKYGYKHGEAVAIGILMAIRMGIDLGISHEGDYQMLEKILKLYSLPTDYYDYKEYLKSSIYDKKNISGSVSFILVKGLGNAIIYKIDENKLREVL